jgi:hypothetical protein
MKTLFSFQFDIDNKQITRARHLKFRTETHRINVPKNNSYNNKKMLLEGDSIVRSSAQEPRTLIHTLHCILLLDCKLKLHKKTRFVWQEIWSIGKQIS